MYDNFRAAIYVFVHDTRRLADRELFQRQFERVSGQLRFDKVYLEDYRSRVFATDEELAAVKSYFQEKGVETAGGITTAVDEAGGQFRSFDYEDPEHRAECREAVERAARHFDEIILDDFFFFNSKSEADIQARGQRSWERYRLETMREVSRTLVLEPARAVNPRVRLTIKYPNWYEHFQGVGYDLEQQPHLFDFIYTGTETRDPYITDQLLQQYQSYLTFRYFSNIRPDGNRGGWVDTYDVRYIDRYAEQLWDTLFAGAPEITLFNWSPMAEERAIAPGQRNAWAGLPTRFDWNEMAARYNRAAPGGDGPGWAAAAGYALEQVDRFVGKLGRPVGLWAYKPYHSCGEDFLHNYLGNIGIPVELTSTFPEHAETLLLTESAAADTGIVDRIGSQLSAGGNVIITSGLVRALQDKGLRELIQIECTGRTAPVAGFVDGYNPGGGRSLNIADEDKPAVFLPEIRYRTNDSWPIIRGVAGAKGYPVVLMNRYAAGVLYVLTIPENPADLYNFPLPLLTQIKRYLLADFPVRLEADALVSLFVYDNNTLIVQSFRDRPCAAVVSVAGEDARLRDLLTGQVLDASGPPDTAGRTDFELTVQPHSYEVFEILAR